MKNKRNFRAILVSLLCMIVLFMGVGYASWEEDFNVHGTTSSGGTWNVHYKDVNVTIPNGSQAVNHQAILDASKKTAILDMSLKQPTDQIIYTFTIANEGNIDAIVDSIEIVEKTNDDAKTYVSPISYTTTGLMKDSKIPAESTATFTVTAQYNHVDSVINEEQKNVSVIVHYHKRTK